MGRAEIAPSSSLTSSGACAIITCNLVKLSNLFREEVDAGKGKCVEFRNMEVSNTAGIMELKNHIETKHGQIDILINNAGMYFYPSLEATEHFVQVQRTLDINYWGMKNVISSFLPLMSDQSRIVNMSSNHGHLSRIPGRSIQMQLGRQETISFDLASVLGFKLY